MTVSELIKELQEMDQSAEVVVSKDAEGNEFSPVAQVDPGTYSADNSWGGEFYSEDDGDVSAVCIWPIN